MCCLCPLSQGATAVDWPTFDSLHTCKCASPIVHDYGLFLHIDYIDPSTKH